MSRAALAVLQPLTERDHLAERTYEAIRAAVLSSDIPPGTQLSVPELARRLEVSRSPVREAVQRLIYEGLASHIPHRGAVVTEVDLAELTNLYVVREPLEGLAARLATETTDQHGLDVLRDILAEHRTLAETAEADIDAHIELDTRFHRTIRELAGNHHLSDVLESIVTHSHSVLHSLWQVPDAAQLALLEHQQILDAMVTGDPDEAERVAREHISRLRIRLRQSIPRDR